jgi:hypothetical protein
MLILACGLTAWVAAARPARADNAWETQVSNRLSKAISLSLSEGRPNEIAKGRVT